MERHLHAEDQTQPLGDFKNINIGDTVAWRGERVSADDSSETWLITSIDKIEER